MPKLINNIIDMKTSISQLEYFSTSLITTAICVQFAISAMLCKIGMNLSAEYFTPIVIIIVELLLLIVIILFTLRFEKIVKDRVLSDDVLSSIADGYTNMEIKSIQNFTKVLSTARQILITTFIMIACLSIVFDIQSCCIVSFFVVFVFFAKTILCLLFGSLFERIF